MKGGIQRASKTLKFDSMIEIDMEINTFISEWLHCDYLSTYLARMISHNRSDSVLHSNLFSSALNELLDHGRRAGVVVCNAPVVEGAVMAATEASGGSPLEVVKRTAEELSAQ